MRKIKIIGDNWFTMLLGTAIMAAAIKLVYDPANLVTGGVSGVSIIIKELTELPLWLSNTILNIPLFIAGYFVKGWKFIRRTIVSTLGLSFFLYIIPDINTGLDDLFLAALFGGVISGIGTGLVFMARSTTGGTDLLAAVLQRFMRHYTVAQIMQVLDGAIVLAGACFFGLNSALYAIIAVIAMGTVTDAILEGMKFSKVAYIISDHADEIAQAIMVQLDRGVTGLNGTGMYSGTAKNVLFCVVSRKEIVQLKDLVSELDRDAFVIVTDAKEVFGEGFIEEAKY
ncbi:MAG: YitT family protein [Lachnospiraceae bacterium]|nr:YitT family protein [Lachnospiraceae bacterium]